MSATSQSANASKTKTDSLQTKIDVQVLYADRVPVKGRNIYYAQDTKDLNELSKDSSLSKYQIDGNPKTDSDGKVTFYTDKRTGLVATSGVVTLIESEDWRTTRIMLTTPSPEKTYKGGSDASDNIATAGCSNDEIEHLSNDATLDDKGKCVKKSSLAETTITISGTVKYPDGSPAQDVYLMPYGEKPTTLNSAKSLSNGSFTISYFPKNKQLVAQFLTENDAVVNYDTISKDPNNVKVEIKSSIDESLIKSDCMNAEQKKKLHALAGKWLEKDKTCVPDECESERYELLNQGTLNATCEDQVGKDCAPENDNLAITGKYAWKSNELTCETDACFDGYTVKDGVCEPTDPTKDRTGENCTTRELQAQDKNATSGTVFVWTEQKVTCTITSCADGWDVDLSDSKCVETTCECGKQWNTSTKLCEKITDTDCTDQIPGATKAQLICEDDKTVCKASECDTANGYELKDGACKCAMGFDSTDGKCTPKMLLTKEQYQDQIKELSDNAQKMHDNENSLINKTIGAAGIGVTGAGGMMLAQSLSETKSDADAERTMAAYLQTFKCDYGDGKQVKGGETNVELPGGNDMIELYTEYATLANDLKVRKEALGLRPGIESEVSIDKSETGLYDDVGTGITGGAYASIARALQDPEGEDAAMWAAQREKTKNTLIAGAVTTGVGAVGSLAANIAVNHNVKNDVNEIKRKYEAMKEPFKNMQKSFDEEPQKTCAELYAGATGSDINNCTCVDNDSYLTQDGCVKCDTEKGLIINQEKNGCECSNSSQILKGTRCEYEDLPSLQNRIGSSGIATPTPQINTCKLRGLVTNECKCISGATTNEFSQCTCDTNNGYVQDGNNCVCNEKDGYKNKIGGGCEKQQPKGESVAQVKIPADSLFDSGKAELKTDAKGKLNKFIAEAQATKVDLSDANAYCLVIVGKTDHQGFKPSSRYYGKGGENQQLSEDRANAVKDYIKGTFNEQAIRSMGIAATDCPTPATNASRANNNCRRVDIIMLAGSCDYNGKNTNWIESEKIANMQKAISTISTNISSSNK